MPQELWGEWKALAEACARAVRGRPGVTYGDIRIVERTTQSLKVKDGRVEAVVEETDQGFGVRILADGAWGFAASHRLTEAEVRRVASLAQSVARASATVNRQKAHLAPVQPAVARYASPAEKDPFAVPLDEKLDLLVRATEILRKDPRVRVAEGTMDFHSTWKVLASTEGALIEQRTTESGGGIAAIAARGGELQRRSYPNSFRGDFAALGYEFIEGMDLVGNAERVREEACMLLMADECPSGEATIIIDSSQLALQVHESCGHPLEMDRVLGTEVSLAGGSFLSVADLGHYRYGSPLVSLTADATLPGGLGTFGYDDEGVPAQRTPLVEKGILVNFLTSRETAALLGLPSNGAMRADGWNRLPLIRMVNVSLDPGDWDLEGLIADTGVGIYLETNKSWSIDHLRLNFQFGTEVAWEIRRGRRRRPLRNALYTGITPRFWASCDAVCHAGQWRLWGIPSCGKGDPMQVAHVGHGAAPARFRGVEVGVRR